MTKKSHSDPTDFYLIRCSRCGQGTMNCHCENFHFNPKIPTFLINCPNCKQEVKVEMPKYSGIITDINHEIFSLNELKVLFRILKYEYINYEDLEAHAVIDRISKIVRDTK